MGLPRNSFSASTIPKRTMVDTVTSGRFAYSAILYNELNEWEDWKQEEGPKRTGKSATRSSSSWRSFRVHFFWLIRTGVIWIAQGRKNIKNHFENVVRIANFDTVTSRCVEIGTGIFGNENFPIFSVPRGGPIHKKYPDSRIRKIQVQKERLRKQDHDAKMDNFAAIYRV